MAHLQRVPVGADPAARRARYRYKAWARSTEWHLLACALVAAGACFSANWGLCGRKFGVEGHNRLLVLVGQLGRGLLVRVHT
jgi:hypothetical protein